MGFGKVAAVWAAASICTATAAVAQDADVMQYADGNGDGKVTQEEYAAFRTQAWSYFTQSADKVKLADIDPTAKGLFSGLTPDANGMVSKEEFLAASPARFKAADKNGDGVLDAAELNASMQGG